MAKQARNKRTSGNIGCGYLFSVAFVICALLVINGLLVKAFVNLNIGELDSRLKQALQFVLPVVMIFVEFWFYDLVNRQREE